MKCLKTLLLVVGHIGGGAFKAFDRAGLEDRAHGHGAAVDLVEGQPVLYLVLVALKDCLAVVHVELDQFPGSPAVVLFHQSIGQLVMADGNQRLDAVLLSQPLGKMRVQLMEVRKILKPISAKRVISSS